MEKIKNVNFPHERDLYGVQNLHLINCTFDGIEDGESALKEARNIKLSNCYMNLRYPIWHVETVFLFQVTMSENCRAALWYTNHINITESTLLGIKSLRECSNATIENCKINSPEFGWKSNLIDIKNTTITGDYLLFLSQDINLLKINMKGKYSFQYVENVVIEDSFLDTKDAFWHSKNVTIKNSIVKGEYLAWYSNNLTLVNCKIIGTQPFCYCNNLKLVNCSMEQTDLSFEYSDVEATIIGSIVSIKNPKSGKIEVDKVGNLIYTDDSIYPCNCVIIQKKQ